MQANNKSKWSFIQGITVHNPVFCGGMAVAPAVFISNTLETALTYSVMFSAVTFFSLMISSFLPRKIPYALRIILYTAAAAAVYIPFYIFFSDKLPSSFDSLGVFIPMIVTSEFVVSASELRFFKIEKPRMAADIISHIIGVDIAVILLGAVRELLATGGINGNLYGISHTIPLLNTPCGAFFLIGIIGALIRICTSHR